MLQNRAVLVLVRDVPMEPMDEPATLVPTKDVGEHRSTLNLSKSIQKPRRHVHTERRQMAGAHCPPARAFRPQSESVGR